MKKLLICKQTYQTCFTNMINCIVEKEKMLKSGSSKYKNRNNYRGKAVMLLV